MHNHPHSVSSDISEISLSEIKIQASMHADEAECEVIMGLLEL